MAVKLITCEKCQTKVKPGIAMGHHLSGKWCKIAEKARNLRRVGWSYGAIALELGVSQQVIGYSLKREKL